MFLNSIRSKRKSFLFRLNFLFSLVIDRLLVETLSTCLVRPSDLLKEFLQVSLILLTKTTVTGIFLYHYNAAVAIVIHVFDECYKQLDSFVSWLSLQSAIEHAKWCDIVIRFLRTKLWIYCVSYRRSFAPPCKERERERIPFKFV